jgi:hypothetical protein
MFSPEINGGVYPFYHVLPTHRRVTFDAFQLPSFGRQAYKGDFMHYKNV